MHSNASNPFRMFRVCIRMPRIRFERFEIGFESFESLSIDSMLESSASNAFRMVQICIGMVRIPLKWFECGFESFESLLNGSNLH